MSISEDIISWLKSCSKKLTLTSGFVSFIFCTDNNLLELNQRFLFHNFYTDVITFDLRQGPTDCIWADVFISIERVLDNSKTLNIEYIIELKRVMIHGILHLCGFDDKSSQEINLIRQMEEELLLL